MSTMVSDTPKRRSRRKFSEEFKQQAARLVLEEAKSMAAAAPDEEDVSGREERLGVGAVEARPLRGTTGAELLARELDLVPTALREWVERARADRTGGKTGLTTAEREGAGAAPERRPDSRGGARDPKKSGGLFAKHQR